MLGRAQQKERQPAIGGGELQPLTVFQIELIDKAGDGRHRARMQRFLDRPQGVFAVRGLRQDQTVRRQSQGMEPMTMRPAIIAQAVSRQDEEDFFPPPLWGRVGWGGGRLGTPVDGCVGLHKGGPPHP
jgi:hypothetical protein